MNKIIRIDSNIDENLLRIELFLSNVCNYKCWYCFPGSNEGTHRWPALEPLISNLSYVLDYYKKNKNKTKFLLHVIGGEPTIWPDLENFIKHFKTNYDTIISISTNASRTIRWWNENGDLFDHVMISCHHQYIDTKHIISVADLLYKKKVNLTALVLMDPSKWDTCVNIVDDLKKSKYRWPITALEVFHSSINYTADQKKYISNSLKRMPNLLWWWKSKRMPYKDATVTYDNRKKIKVPNNWLSINALNSFKNWKCNLGIDTFFIDKNGNMQGACGENLYDLDFKYNIFEKDFISNFHPDIKSTTCKQEKCYCQPEINTTKFIPITSV